MCEIVIYRGGEKEDLIRNGTREEMKEFLINGYTWNDDHEIFVSFYGEIRYYVKYDDEFKKLIEIL